MSWKTVKLMQQLGQNLGLTLNSYLTNKKRKKLENEYKKGFEKFKEQLAITLPSPFSSAILSARTPQELSLVERAYGISATDINAKSRMALSQKKEKLKNKDPFHIHLEKFKKIAVSKPYKKDYNNMDEYIRDMKKWGQLMGMEYGVLKKYNKKMPERWEAYYNILLTPRGTKISNQSLKKSNENPNNLINELYK